MKRKNSHCNLTRVVALLAQLPLVMSVQAQTPLDRVAREYQEAVGMKNQAGIYHKGLELASLHEQAGNLKAAAEVGFETVLAADRAASPAETIEAVEIGQRLIMASRPGNMRPGDWLSEAHLAGIASKHLMKQGLLSAVKSRQLQAWEYLNKVIKMEGGGEWKSSQPIPRTMSEETLSILLRTARYDADLMEFEGRNVEALDRMKTLEKAVAASGLNGGIYRNQLLGQIAAAQKFLGFWRDCINTLDRIIAAAEPDSSPFQSARLNRAYWSSQYDGPDPALLEQAKDAAKKLGLRTSVSEDRNLRRVLAKMAYAYREAGFEIGDLAQLVKESEQAGDKLEAIYARRDLGVIQRKTEDFPQAEANLLSALAQVRAIGKKSGEPTLYLEYGILLRDTGRAKESVAMISEAVRLTKSFRWEQHPPNLLHSLAQAQHAAGDLKGVLATLGELEKLAASGRLEPARLEDAGVAMAFCLQATGRGPEAAAMLKQTAAQATRSGVPAWQISWTEHYPLSEIIPIKASTVAAAATDLEPVRIRSEILKGETTHVRFTLSNPSASSVTGVLYARGSHLKAQWQDDSATGTLSLGESGGEGELKHEVSLNGYEEFQILAEASKSAGGLLELRWQPQQGAEQKAVWEIAREDHDGPDLAVTNANLAGLNPFYALRLHHTIARRGGGVGSTAFLRVISSIPMRLEINSVSTGQLLAVDANGDGSLDGPGDLLMSDARPTGSSAVSIDGENEIELLLYPVSGTERPQGEVTIDVQLQGPGGWESCAKDLLTPGPK